MLVWATGMAVAMLISQDKALAGLVVNEVKYMGLENPAGEMVR